MDIANIISKKFVEQSNQHYTYWQAYMNVIRVIHTHLFLLRVRERERFITSDIAFTDSSTTWV